MPENLVCEKCGQRFNNRQELQKHAQECIGKGTAQGGMDQPRARGAGGTSSTE